MSIWERHGMAERVRAALHAVHLNDPSGHHFGRPFVSSYQIAIALDVEDPQLRHVLGKQVGGVGVGTHDSLAQYVGNELSKQIRADPTGLRRGVFMSNERIDRIMYRGADGTEVVSSLTGTGYDMALFRLRIPPAAV